ncbi:MAG TPA: response regulator [Thiolapillus brandeum]|uniref:Response regulator n=1 Tax=Thiolapillus brandeum TaxID=1076588 RepID=A0A831RYZ0_9GAMM|nr:response regulator [Thiolapillus brandeum]
MGNFSIKRFFRRDRARAVQVIRDRRRNYRNVPGDDACVLVVDDSKTIRFALKKMLSQGGYRVLEADNGKDAIELAQNHGPVLIIMDIVMPGLNGFQATRRMRKLKETRDIPIVIMSGNKEATEQFWIDRIGANDFMGKPFSRHDVFQRVERTVYQNEIA